VKFETIYEALVKELPLVFKAHTHQHKNLLMLLAHADVTDTVNLKPLAKKMYSTTSTITGVMGEIRNYLLSTIVKGLPLVFRTHVQRVADSMKTVN